MGQIERFSIVIENGTGDVARLAGEQRRLGHTVIRTFRTAGPDDVAVAEVATSDDAADCVRAVLRGASVIAVARAEREILDRLCDDLRRLGPLEHRTGTSTGSSLRDLEAEALALIADGHTNVSAARELGVSRRTFDRRLAAAREAFGVRSTAEAVARRRATELR